MDELKEGGGLIFAIAENFWARFSVDFLIFITEAAIARLSFFYASFTAASWAKMVIMVGGSFSIGWELPSGSGGRLGPRSSLLDSGFSATILVISRLWAC